MQQHRTGSVSETKPVVPMLTPHRTEVLPDLPQRLMALVEDLVTVFYVSGSTSTTVTRGLLRRVRWTRRFVNGPLDPTIDVVPKDQTRPISIVLDDAALLVRGNASLQADIEAVGILSGHIFRANAMINLVGSRHEVQELVLQNQNLRLDLRRVMLVHRELVGSHIEKATYVHFERRAKDQN